MITRESIERVLEADILEVLQKVLPNPLKKTGANYRALSPFVDEKSPSFMLSQSKNVWKDFSSGKGGVGPVSFIMQFRNKSWIEAIIEVAELSNTILQYEELDDEEKERQGKIEQQRLLLETAKNRFRKYFELLKDNDWAKQNIAAREYSDLTLEQFQIGYAVPNSNDLTAPLKEKGHLQDGIDIGIVAQKEKRTFDFFNDRLIFPVLDDRGRTIGFGGRAEGDKKPKYLNSPETNHYKKDMVLYGLFQARQNIVKYNQAYLTEGYTDVIAFHDKEVINTVATCGTALMPEHVKKLKKLCSHVVIVRDGDGAGLRAAFRDIDLLLASGMRVSIVPMPTDEDPDSISRKEKENLQSWLDKNMQDALSWKSTKLKLESKNPDDISFAVTNVCESLMQIKDSIRRKEYAKICAKKIGVSIKDFQDKLDTLSNLEKQKKNNRKDIHEDERYELIIQGFPEDGDVSQYKKDGYVLAPEEKAIYFFVKNEKTEYFFKGANFICNPLFVIRSAKNEGKRLIEFENSVGEKTVFAMNNKEISNYAQFKEKILDGYNFTFDGKTTNYHFTQFRNRMLYNFDVANELRTLGKQKEGFFSTADGVIFDKKFWPVDEYGIVQVEIEEDVEERVKAYKNMFYLPAFSKVNIGNREDDDDYESVRNFVYKESDITFNQWMMLFYKVYGPEKAMIGIAFAISALFRSSIVNQFGSFPYLFLTGQRNSGKTKFSESITNLFTPNQKSYDLNTGTMVGFFNRISKIRDIVIGMEEFTDQIHEVKFQSLKAGYDNRSREKGQKTGTDNAVVKVNSACIILSQYLSVRDDNSLTSRSITMNFLEQNYTSEQKTTFNRLKASEKKGMTSMLLELLQYQTTIDLQLSVTIEELNRSLSKDIKGEYMERMLDNFVSIMAPIKILYKKFVFPFKMEEFYKLSLETIVAASDMINDTEGTAVFWRTLEFLVDNKRIKQDEDFIIETKPIFTIWPKKNESKNFENKLNDKILFLRLGKVHQDYVEAVSRRKNEDPIGEATLRGYFKSKPYYIGAVKAIHFENGSGSCYAFNYTMMEKTGVLNIVRDFKNSQIKDPEKAFPHDTAAQSFVPAGASDDLPF
ncbi:DNA primase [Flavobacterium sp. HNIBRBA15423]|uniref:DNA primase n=1 Tax=Flavobacterium sp. HNIBRBA15423 TaxID=3458683 RepID=UPI004043EF03